MSKDSRAWLMLSGYVQCYYVLALINVMYDMLLIHNMLSNNMQEQLGWATAHDQQMTKNFDHLCSKRLSNMLYVARSQNQRPIGLTICFGPSFNRIKF